MSARNIGGSQRSWKIQQRKEIRDLSFNAGDLQTLHITFTRIDGDDSPPATSGDEGSVHDESAGDWCDDKTCDHAEKPEEQQMRLTAKRNQIKAETNGRSASSMDKQPSPSASVPTDTSTQLVGEASSETVNSTRLIAARLTANGMFVVTSVSAYSLDGNGPTAAAATMRGISYDVLYQV